MALKVDVPALPGFAREDESEAIEGEVVAPEVAGPAGADNLATAGMGLLPSPTNPMHVAREVVADMHHADGVPTITWWRGDFYRWNGGRWKAIDDDTIDGWLYKRTEHATYMGTNRKGEPVEVAWSPTLKKIADLRGALARGVLQRDIDEEPADGRGQVSTTNGVFDVVTRTLSPATPRRFNLVQVPFAYNPDATAPRWEEFLKEISDGDGDIVTLIQDWFGLVLFGDTAFQKILYLKGPERCGKGTIARILTALVGSESVASPSLGSLGGSFGAQSLIGKTLTIVPDAKWAGRDLAAACEVLLKTSGEDEQNINRKYLKEWIGVLPSRIMILSNEAPRPHSNSTALANRFLIAHLRVSFLGREDRALTGKLREELPGIFNWALDGYDRLTARGHFIEPASSGGIKDQVKTGSSTVRAFVDEMCAEEGTVTLPVIYKAYRAWAKDHAGVIEGKILERDQFAADLGDVVNDLKRGRKTVDGKKVTVYQGVSLMG